MNARNFAASMGLLYILSIKNICLGLICGKFVASMSMVYILCIKTLILKGLFSFKKTVSEKLLWFLLYFIQNVLL